MSSRTSSIPEIDELLSLVKADLPDEFYALPENERTKRLNEMFPVWLDTLPADKKTRLFEIVDQILAARSKRVEQRFIDEMMDEIRLEHAVGISSFVNLTSIQRRKLLAGKRASTSSPTMTKER
jgi:hypothetical protein